MGLSPLPTARCVTQSMTRMINALASLYARVSCHLLARFVVLAGFCRISECIVKESMPGGDSQHPTLMKRKAVRRLSSTNSIGLHQAGLLHGVEFDSLASLAGQQGLFLPRCGHHCCI